MKSPLRVEEVSGGYVVKEAEGKVVSAVLSLAEASKMANGANCFPAMIKILKLVEAGNESAVKAAESFLEYLGNYAEVA